MRIMLRYILVSAIVLVTTGCAYKVGYNSSYLPPAGIAGKVDGKALVVMTAEEVEWVYSGHPTSFTGGGTTLTVPLGNITKQVALEVFSRHFDRVDSGVDLSAAAEYLFVVNPRISKFEYAFIQLQNLGFAITPEVIVNLDVKLFDAAGKQLMQKSYVSGEREGDSYMMSGSPNEKINKILHETLFDLMSQAAVDAHSIL